MLYTLNNVTTVDVILYYVIFINLKVRFNNSLSIKNRRYRVF